MLPTRKLRTYEAWRIEPELDPQAKRLRRRRWRVLREAMPITKRSHPAPLWVSTPNDFVGGVLIELSVDELQAYFGELR